MKCSCATTKEEAKCKDPPNELLKSIKIVVDKNQVTKFPNAKYAMY
jgi:hypothetical protein